MCSSRSTESKLRVPNKTSYLLRKQQARTLSYSDRPLSAAHSMGRRNSGEHQSLNLASPRNATPHMIEFDITTPARREQVLSEILPESAKQHHQMLRQLFAAEIE